MEKNEKRMLMKAALKKTAGIDSIVDTMEGALADHGYIDDPEVFSDYFWDEWFENTQNISIEEIFNACMDIDWMICSRMTDTVGQAVLDKLKERAGL